MNPKIVIIGSCSVDFTTYSPRLPKPGETLHGTKFITSFGGKGANQCVAAAKQGGNTYMIGRVGNDHWGQQYKDNLKSHGIDVTYTHITNDVTTGIAQISVAENGENQIIIVPGANNYLSKADVDEAKELIENADIIIAQLETPFEITLETFKLNKGIKLLNAAPARTDIQEILPYCTILCVNETEASLLVGFEVEISNIKVALDKLLETGCEIALITLGHQGAAYCLNNTRNYIHVLCDKVTAVDTTGAGDAFVGALGTFLVNKKNIDFHQIVGAACEIATLSVTKEGTQTSYPEKYDVFNKKFKYVCL
ncbi:ribokinase-like [Danaus plexippus]|uniref:Ribokinase n=1 Tax=Danaus plexippus plexippus TaxID=278856 RepID=A0A212EN32_DANPL|nr:ribokinase-like [Danaus plexippus]OWR42861.1 ribokinase [Danaus plexippus plexippus]